MLILLFAGIVSAYSPLALEVVPLSPKLTVTFSIGSLSEFRIIPSTVAV